MIPVDAVHEPAAIATPRPVVSGFSVEPNRVARTWRWSLGGVLRFADLQACFRIADCRGADVEYARANEDATAAWTRPRPRQPPAHRPTHRRTRSQQLRSTRHHHRPAPRRLCRRLNAAVANAKRRHRPAGADFRKGCGRAATGLSRCRFGKASERHGDERRWTDDPSHRMLLVQSAVCGSCVLLIQTRRREKANSTARVTQMELIPP